jgi:hypothetical protein
MMVAWYWVLCAFWLGGALGGLVIAMLVVSEKCGEARGEQ